MRTIRLKIYRLNELSIFYQDLAIKKEAERTAIMFSGSIPPFFNDHVLESCKNYLIKHKVEFTWDGQQIPIIN